LATSQVLTVEKMTIESLFDVCNSTDTSLEWTCPFIHPAFMKSWWNHFRKNRKLLVLGIKENDELLGIAPLMEQSGCARFIGSPEVCDYQDVIVVPDKAQIVLTSLLNHLRQTGITRLCLGMVRSDSFVYRHINHSAEAAGAKIVRQKTDVCYELNLTDTWDIFLDRLSGKQRHEVRRKIRRLDEAGNHSFRCIKDESHTEKAMKTFFSLFKANRLDKAAFMNDQMASFFRDMAQETARAGLLRLFFLDIDNSPVASVLCFEFGDRFYLYNNGYDLRFQKLGVGVLSKFLSIKAAIESSKKIYDFLKGDEPYKERMGGYPLPLYDFEIFF
jgi:CelD/BcsL family acetyltransferase involved in cellulose biosynthesis